MYTKPGMLELRQVVAHFPLAESVFWLLTVLSLPGKGWDRALGRKGKGCPRKTSLSSALQVQHLCTTVRGPSRNISRDFRHKRNLHKNVKAKLNCKLHCIHHCK